MKPVHTMPVPKPSINSGASAPVVSDETRRFVNQIFAELQAAKPAWRQAFPTDEALANAKITWMKALVENRITNKNQISQGLRMVRQSESDFLPSVGKFIAWCKTSASVPDVGTAFDMLDLYIRGEHGRIPDEVKAMFDLLGRQLLRTGSTEDIRRAFKRNYKFVCEKINDGHSIREYLIEKLPKPAEQTVTPKEREERRLRILAEIQKTRRTLRSEK